MRSSSLIPSNDPTLFFTNAGMVQFKNVFLGLEKLPTKRATTSQKCLRVSGKHNDLENVGRTHRHHTFFEMLGNFSFGDYFKSEAIQYAWEFLIDWVKLDSARLSVSVFKEDEEAARIWEKEIGISPDKIFRLGEKDNFWSMGEEGPCGPCSEIYFDHGPAQGCGKPNCAPGCDCDRFMEIWNLVFMQYNRSMTGELSALPRPSVDTGMGLERLSCVVQGVVSNYSSDLFTPLIQAIERLVGHSYGKSEKTDISIRVLADHIRASCFLIGDGIQPSNEGRGYVLRRILRRAIRHGWLLGKRDPFFYQLVETLVREMSSAYPELSKHQSFITSVIQAEETRFLETLEKGMQIIQEEIASEQKGGRSCFRGEMVFKLYDTFGFPVDLIQTIADEEGFSVDMEGFEQAMLAQKETARRAWRGSGEERVAQVYQELAQHLSPTSFAGYDALQGRSKVLALIRNGEAVQEVKEGDEIQLIAEKTPFYGESGGQVGDVGWISAANFKMEVTDAQKPIPAFVVHQGKALKGALKLGEAIHLEVDPTHRTPTRLNHTATHLLHAALRKTLGDHVRQAGSLVAPHRLRFDFSHYEPLSPETLEQIEHLVNAKIREDLSVQKTEMGFEEAMGKNAMALFGEKYGERVRVLEVGDFSLELCGGTHVDRTGEIGFFKIIQETSVAAGVRRIEALTGADAVAYTHKLERELKGISQQLKVGTDELPSRITRLLEQQKKFEKEIAQLKSKLLSGVGPQEEKSEIREKNGVRFLALKTDLAEVPLIRQLADQTLQRIQPGVVLIVSVYQQKITLIAKVSPTLISQFSAGKIIQTLAPLVGGSGGGKAEMAQGGGNLPDKVEEMIQKFYEFGG